MISFKEFCEENNIPLTTMSNFDIIRIVKQLKIPNFRGVFMRDSLPKKPRTIECGIVNLEPESEKGSHWCCYYKNREASEGQQSCYYFHSYGLDSTNEMLKYLKPNKKSKVVMSTFEIQKLGTVICGQMCIYVLYMLSQRHNFIDILLSLMQQFGQSGKTGDDLNDDIDLVG